MIPYEETKRGWDKAAATNPNAAIHPAGALDDFMAYDNSGTHDSNMLMWQLFNITRDDGKDKTIIDFGCGNGRVTKPLSFYFKTVYAVDFSYAMLQQIGKNWMGETSAIKNIQPVLSVDNWFGLSEPADYAFSISVFIHNTYESGVKMMKSISDNMKVGGIALLQIPVYEFAKEPSGWSDVGVWAYDMLAKACRETGFGIIESFTNPGKFSFYNIGPNHHKFQVLKKIS